MDGVPLWIAIHYYAVFMKTGPGFAVSSKWVLTIAGLNEARDFEKSNRRWGITINLKR